MNPNEPCKNPSWFSNSSKGITWEDRQLTRVGGVEDIPGGPHSEIMQP